MEIKKTNKLENIRNKYKDNKQIIKLDTSLATENYILNEQRIKWFNYGEEYDQWKSKKKIKIKGIYRRRIIYWKKYNRDKGKKISKNSKKYLVDNENNKINELNTNEEQTKENKLIKSKSLINDIINNEIKKRIN